MNKGVHSFSALVIDLRLKRLIRLMVIPSSEVGFKLQLTYASSELQLTTN